MSKVFVNIGLSLDGYMAPEGMTMGKPEYKNWGAKWGAMMAWILKQQCFRENLVVEELEIALAPVLFGSGRRLFENIRDPGPRFRIDGVLDGPAATHLRYVGH